MTLATNAPLAGLISRAALLFPLSAPKPNTTDWKQGTSEIGESLRQAWQDLQPRALANLPKRIARENQSHLLISEVPELRLATCRMTASTESQPESERTGVALTIYRGYGEEQHGSGPAVSVELEVRGAVDRAAFVAFFRDHRRLAQRFMQRERCAFETACVFASVDAADVDDPFEQLEAYCQEPTDDESMFVLRWEFDARATSDSIVRALESALALYDATLGYARSRIAQRDRILEAVHLLERGH